MRKLLPIIIIYLIFSLNSCNVCKNESPVILNVIHGIDNVYVGSEVRLTCTASGDDNDLLTYSWTSSCGDFINSSSSSSVYWKAPDDPGSCNITVVVSDGELFDEYTFFIEVEMEEVSTPMVGVYYYPWYGSGKFHGGNYLREHLIPVQNPELGEYNDRESEVIEKHLNWSRYAGIGLWVSSWWGPQSLEDVTLLDYILEHPSLEDMKIALFYETTGRTNNFTNFSNLESDISFIADNYFDHPNYYKIDGKPVLFIYLTRVLSQNGTLESTLTAIRNTATSKGFDIYIVGDQVFGQPPSSGDQISLLDAITNYDVYGSSGAKMYATQEKVNFYYTAQAGWRSMAHQSGVSFIPATSPGFNDRGVRSGHEPLSRKLSENSELGSLFQAMLDEALKITDLETGNLFMVTSWNEWHEDTQIEPVTAAPPTNIDDSESGQDYTGGLEYEGYGEKYLTIIKEAISRR